MVLPSPSVDPLVRAAQTGDAAAWDALIAQHGPLVYGLCRRLDPAPDDAYQAIWEKAFAGLHRFDPAGPEPLRAWLATLAHRHLVDRHRRRVVRRVVLPFATPPEQPDPGPSPEGALLASDTQALVERALAQLPAPARRVLVMHHMLGQDLSAVAAAEGVAIGTIKSRLHRGRMRLRALLPPDLIGDPE